MGVASFACDKTTTDVLELVSSSMTFLQRQRTRSYKNSNNSTLLDKDLPELPFPVGIENVPQTVRSTKSADGKQHRLLKRVGSMFSPRKRPNLDSQLVYTNHQTKHRQSYEANSIRSSHESEADIRCPSGLGSAVSIISKRSLPPSPFCPPNGSPYNSGASQTRLLKRAISSPNLLRSFSIRVKGKTQGRRASVLPNQNPSGSPVVQNSVRRQVSTPGCRLSEEIISLILCHLPRSNVASCATVSRTFASATRSFLFGAIDTSTISLAQLEKLIVVLSSRSYLAELVASFICPEWPPFFTSSKDHNAYEIRQRDTVLTATFTLALERMFNLTSLTLPSFDASFIAHHTSFGLKSITFLVRTMTEAERRFLFAWLDGQVNISTLRFPNLVDVDINDKPLGSRTNKPLGKSNVDNVTYNHCLRSTPVTANGYTLSPRSTLLSNPTPSSSSIITQNLSPFASPTLLPNLSTLHATPSLTMLFCAALEKSSLTRRPIQTVWLNINTTLYNGLRPAKLMSSLVSISHLGLVFSANVDKRSFEKVIGAAGASLGSASKDSEDSDDAFIIVEKNGLQSTLKSGLHTLEISFQTSATQPGRDEALYKSLQASLPRYTSLSTLRFSIQTTVEPEQIKQTKNRAIAEQDMVELWAKICPTLTSITLFSGTQWKRGER